MTKQEAFTWIKNNFDKLVEEKKLAEAMSRYFKKFGGKYPEVLDKDPKEEEDPDIEAALKVFGSPIET